MNAVRPHLAGLGDLNQQQVQLLQRIWHPRQESVRLPTFDR